MNETIEIAIYAEHCVAKGCLVIPSPDHESSDWDWHKGTPAELRTEAAWYFAKAREENGGHGAYLERVGQTLSDIAGLTEV